MIRKLMILCTLICSVQLPSCQETNPDKQSDATDVAITSHTTESQTDDSSEMTNQDEFVMRRVELPVTMDTSCAKLINSFDYTEIIQSEQTEQCSLVAIDHDDVIIQKSTDTLDDNAIWDFYKYNVSNGTLTKLSGNVPRCNYSMATYALVNGVIYSVCESSSSERFHFSVDLRKNLVEVQKTMPVIRGAGNLYEESFYMSFAFDEHSYIEKWYELGNEVVHHIIRHDGDHAKEVVTQKGILEYAFSNQKIYELVRDDSRHMRYVHIRDAEGNLESTLYLPEVDAAANAIASEYLSIWDFNVFGDYLQVNVRDEDKMAETCFLYHLKQKTVDQLQDCRFLQPAQATDSNIENLYFYSMNSGETGILYNLYRLDREGNIVLLAENLRMFSSMVTDGKNAAYLDQNKLYFISGD